MTNREKWLNECLKQFTQEHGIDIKKDKITFINFCELPENVGEEHKNDK